MHALVPCVVIIAVLVLSALINTALDVSPVVRLVIQILLIVVGAAIIIAARRAAKEAAIAASVRWPCPACKEEFTGEAGLQYHLRGTHPNYKLSAPLAPTVAAPTISAHDQRDSLPADASSYTCTACREVFVTRDEVTIHIDARHGGEASVETPGG